MSVWGAAFLGVGSMVGAGVFALFGEAAAIAGSAVWISFLLGGFVSALLGYVVVKLGVRYPSAGGLVAYLLEGFGDGHVTSITAWLYYFSALIVTAMVSVSFGNYAAGLFFDEDASTLTLRLLTTAIVVLMGVVSIVGAKAISKVQSVIVIVLLVVFAVFVVATLSQFQPELLSPSGDPPLGDIMPSVALTFFAYLGFAIISFAAGDLADPGRELPRAMMIALGLTTTLYVLLSFGVFGTLTVEQVIENGDTALAMAAVPVLGQMGFVMMSIAAMLATASSVNANIYGAGNLTASLAKSGLFPSFFGGPSRLGGTRGLVLTLALVIVLANVFDLTAIAQLGSANALGIFLLLTIAGYRLREETGANTFVIVAAAASTAIVLVLFLVDLVTTAPQTLTAFVAFLVLAVVFDLAWGRVRTKASTA